MSGKGGPELKKFMDKKVMRECRRPPLPPEHCRPFAPLRRVRDHGVAPRCLLIRSLRRLQRTNLPPPPHLSRPGLPARSRGEASPRVRAMP